MSENLRARNAEGVESRHRGLHPVSMPVDDSLDRDTLSSKTVADLRAICRDRSLLVSGRKSELVDRILDDLGSSETITVETTPKETDRTPEPLILDEEPEDEETPPHWRGSEAIEAELVEAELVETEPEIQSEKTAGTPESSEFAEDAASLVITIPTLSSLGERWKALATVAVVVILVGALATNVLQRNAGFTARTLHFGEQMDFFVSDSEIGIIGEEMLSLVRDATGGILDDACGEIGTEFSGTGSVSITDGFESGAVDITDSLGRGGFLAVEKEISMDLDVDFTGKTWKDPGECGNVGWSLSDNHLFIDSRSWIEIEDNELKRTDSLTSFRDVDSVTTNLRSVTYDMEGLGGIGGLVTTLLFPMTPIELHDFFGDAEIKEGARSSDPEVNWKSDWKWEVKGEVNHETHGLVYPIEMEHEDIGRCYGHAYLTLLVSKNSPWPVKQDTDIVIDKDQQSNDCDFLVSSLSEEILPEGTLTIRMSISKTSAVSGSTEVDWGRDYGKTTAGEDRPGTSSERNWVDSMWDESEIRPFVIEEAISCLKANHSTSQASQALVSGGYIWKAQWSQPTPDAAEWNLSWVDDNDRSGWVVLGEVVGTTTESCEITSQGTNDDDVISWNRDSIPDTQTMSLLEERILEQDRYPDLAQVISSDASSGARVWHSDAVVGYRLSVTQDNDYLSLLPGDLGDGKVTLTGSRDWQGDGRDYSVNLVMDAETGEMVAWYQIDRPSG